MIVTLDHHDLGEVDMSPTLVRVNQTHCMDWSVFSFYLADILTKSYCTTLGVAIGILANLDVCGSRLFSFYVLRGIVLDNNKLNVINISDMSLIVVSPCSVYSGQSLESDFTLLTPLPTRLFTLVI